MRPWEDLDYNTQSKSPETGADRYTYSNEKNGLQQFQMESCQPIKRFKDKNKTAAFKK